MQVIVKVVHVEERIIKDKPVAKVIMLAGEETITAILWSNEVSKHTHKQAAKVIGQLVVTELQAEVYKGQLRYGFGYAPTFIPLPSFVKAQATAPVSSVKERVA